MKRSLLCLALSLLLPSCATDEDDGSLLYLSGPKELKVGDIVLIGATFYQYPGDRLPSPPLVSRWSATGPIVIKSYARHSAMIEGTGEGKGTITAYDASNVASHTVTVTPSGALVVGPLEADHAAP